ncbi:MAG: hypothetical protein A2632_02000 [Candidatus Pacebacteria bacterium RIFCSPHIGHO2_01_FULL_46_16]|nr:MAG: hypothetical protein A2632_02000 [Candidatus Pacebacteria bacterium RIFCSPHIGHO2_01_FULL_46_16]OGJ22321.1 MAG: hypothetical protein A3J60_01760 [Candidatus Pacebacteria bacterium RIFCSPHIGHO2_02_FULL_46_9]OGJ37373.1 MAG: hypothetical protein A3A82_02600 [Candidatus Pacebacteria bacterium RIFCSPLOWO2_01_FULL_47_12]
MHTKADFFFTSYDGEQLFANEHCNSLKPEKTYILFSGLGGCSTSWHFFIKELLQLRPESRCIAVDLRGHGKSSHAFSAQADNVLDCFAKDLATLIEQVAADRTKLYFVGHSLGCLILQTFLTQQEKNPFAEIFLCAGRVKISPLGINFTWLYPMLASWSKNHKHGMRQLSLEEQLRYKNTFDFHIPRVLNDITIIGKVTYVLLWLCIFGWQSRKIAFLNTQKTHWIFGKKDMLIQKKELSAIYARYPQAQYHHIDSNHCIVVNQPLVAAHIVAENS